MKRLFKRFDYQHAYNWFEENGVPLVTQEDQCVFPQSQDSHSIIDCLVNTAKRLGVKIQCNHQLTAITELEDERLLLDFKVSKGNLSGASSASFQKASSASHPVSEIVQIAFHRVAITTGGHPKMESFKHLSDLGHAIEQPIPSLFTFNIADKAFKSLDGHGGRTCIYQHSGHQTEGRGAAPHHPLGHERSCRAEALIPCSPLSA